MERFCGGLSSWLAESQMPSYHVLTLQSGQVSSGSVPFVSALIHHEGLTLWPHLNLSISQRPHLQYHHIRGWSFRIRTYEGGTQFSHRTILLHGWGTSLWCRVSEKRSKGNERVWEQYGESLQMTMCLSSSGSLRADIWRKMKGQAMYLATMEVISDLNRSNFYRVVEMKLWLKWVLKRIRGEQTHLFWEILLYSKKKK